MMAVPHILAAIVLFINLGSRVWAIEDDYETAWQEVRRMNFERAILLFEQAYADFPPGSTAARAAATGLAISLLNRQPDRESDKRRAGELLDKLLKDIPLYPIERADRLVVYLRARMLTEHSTLGGSAENTPSAEHLYRRLLGDGQSDIFAELATVEMALQALSGGLIKKSINKLSARADSNPGNPLSATQRLLAGNIALHLQDDRGVALTQFRKALDDGIPSPALQQSYTWGASRLALQIGDKSAARIYFQTILSDFPWTIYADESRRALEQLDDANFKQP